MSKTYDSDDEGPPPSLEEGHLSWRLPAEESHSDWTIEIAEANAGGGEDDDGTIKVSHVYHVHKNVLSVGPKKSLYFERLFQNKNFSESDTKTSRIELNHKAVLAFPQMLDYLYSQEHKLELTTDDATALCFLGQYFEIHRLRWEASRFCKIDMSLDTVATYYQHAKIFHDEKISKLVAKKCCDELSLIAIDSQLVKVSDVALWRDIIQLIRDGRSGLFYDSRYLSRLIAEFCSNHKEQVDSETFTHFTDATHMLVVAKQAAVPLLQLEGYFTPTSNTSELLSSLQGRCVGALASSWRSIDVPSLQHALSKLNPLILTFIYTKAFAEAKQKVDKLNGIAAREVVWRVVVEGAETDNVNGVYTRTKSYFNGAPSFTINRTSGDQPAVFTILLGESSNTLFWLIQMTVGSQKTNCYYIKHTEGSVLHPPRSGWTSTHSNSREALTLQLLLREDTSNIFICEVHNL